MFHPRSLFRGKKITTRGFEELQSRLVFEGGGVRHIDHDLSAGQRSSQSFTSERVHARRRSCRHYFMTVLTKSLHRLRPDESRTPNDYDLPLVIHVRFLSLRIRIE